MNQYPCAGISERLTRCHSPAYEAFVDLRLDQSLGGSGGPSAEEVGESKAVAAELVAQYEAANAWLWAPKQPAAQRRAGSAACVPRT